ncbi:hypothetical protein PRIPAC_85835, partial [Pristionchus pacificus]
HNLREMSFLFVLKQLHNFAIPLMR